MDSGRQHKLSDRAVELFRAGWCCSEATLLAFSEVYGVKCDLIPKIATSFCGGMARRGLVCGAVTGGAMAIGILTGRSAVGDSRELNHELVQKLMDRFQAKFGTIVCRGLVGCRLDTPDGHKQYLEKNLREKCVEYVRVAGEILEDLIHEIESKREK